MGIRRCTRNDYFSRWHEKHQKFFQLPEDPLEATSTSWPSVPQAVQRDSKRWLIIGSILHEEDLYHRFTSFLYANRDDTVLFFFPPYAPYQEIAHLYEFDNDTPWGEIDDPEAEPPLYFAEGRYFHVIGSSGLWASYFYEKESEYIFMSDDKSCIDLAQANIPLRSVEDVEIPDRFTDDEKNLYS